jgi:chorismate mutase
MTLDSTKLDEARARIDAADRAALSAFGERIAAVREVSAYKAANGLPVWDGGREGLLLRKIYSLSPEPLKTVSPLIWKLLMAAARRSESSADESADEPAGRFMMTLPAPETVTDALAMIGASGAGLSSIFWAGTELQFSVSRPLPGSLLRDIREHGFHLKRIA